MYRPTTIGRHDLYLEKFIKLFNATEPQYMRMEIEQRPYIRDGIIHLRYGTIGFDFEVRDDWKGSETYHQFPYATLGQLERKFDPQKEIDLSIQTNVNMRWIAIAWHREFGPPKEVERTTNHNWLEKGQMRETTKFQVFHISHLDQIKHWICTHPPPVCDYGTPPVPSWQNCLTCPLYRDGHCTSRGVVIWRAIHGEGEE
jgi:hypothetical protein